MKNKKFTKTQIISILYYHEKRLKGADICLEHGIS
jgi:hypothetical protein